MRRYLAPLGFAAQRLTRPIISNGINGGDRIVVLQPAANQGRDDYSQQHAKRALDETLELFDHVDNRIQIVSVPVVCTPFEVALRECSALITSVGRAPRVGTAENKAAREADNIKKSDDVETIICPGAGARELLLALHTASLAHSGHVSETVLHGDLGSDPEILSVPRVNAHVPKRTMKTFDAFLNNASELSETRITDMEDAVTSELTVSELTSETGQSKSTVGRHLDALESEGLVTTGRKGKERYGQLTLAAELLLRDRHQD